MKCFFGAIVLGICQIVSSSASGEQLIQTVEMPAYTDDLVIPGHNLSDFKIVGIRTARIPRLVEVYQDDECEYSIDWDICFTKKRVVKRIEIIQVIIEANTGRLPNNWGFDEDNTDRENYVFNLPVSSISRSAITMIRKLSSRSLNPFRNAENENRLAKIANKLFEFEIKREKHDRMVIDYEESPFYCDDEFDDCDPFDNEIVYRKGRSRVTKVILRPRAPNTVGEKLE